MSLPEFGDKAKGCRCRSSATKQSSATKNLKEIIDLSSSRNSRSEKRKIYYLWLSLPEFGHKAEFGHEKSERNYRSFVISFFSQDFAGGGGGGVIAHNHLVTSDIKEL